jgi:lysophospholipase L1-like esterase
MKYLAVLSIVLTVFVLGFGNHYYNQKLETKGKIAKAAFIEDQKREKLKEKLEFPWKDSNWYAIGDSITASQKYQELVKRGLALNSIVTDAEPGQSIKTMAANVTKEKLANVDLITVFGGTNDYGGNKPLGTFKDDKSDDTFYGYLKNVIETINANKNEKALVVFFTPIKRGEFPDQPTYPDSNAGGNGLEDYVNAINEVCESYSIPVVDLYSKSGIDSNNLKQYTLDNLHPNDAGYQMISKVIIDDLKAIK